MVELTLDTGVREYRIAGGGVLRFHPADPNLYARFLQAEEKLRKIEKELEKPGEADVLTRLCKADKAMKKLLTWVFGEENDFHKALGGVNLLATGSNGKLLAENLLEALGEILTEGAERFASDQVARLKDD